ncbi:uncharacterized protein PHACADRAFT_261985 [Phanerochaete carnosa HHB-10118-sp]|uniref:Carboxypeptidase n=1 Tax=Phanerochaete carnosa (strain HHB-10118-sp) TaxID=650164 RepID=K5VYK6_PHACS|nr:uncharacterized protein PHACADRAFT_261985 [Phanerochaete carnosa HHB-10118-sp]EKM51694.1 hypothetical protein PHACADRAFT_261985 [Phanerochaete carnosa HHB-10118-sp]
MFSALAGGVALLGLAASSVVSGAQQPFALSGGKFESYDAGLFSPVEDLGLLSTSEFTALAHPTFPNYNVRIKKSDFCDGTVRAFTGYIDIEARHLFFYFFESRSNPDKDDVIFWTNGGPGCSSSLGLFMELGPCRVNDVHNVTFNPYSWNENANIFFIDQPIGVGFSYADHGEYVSTTEDAAKDIAAFVAIFFEHFSSFKGRAFHMAGESYGGRYVPAFASAVYDQNSRLVAVGMAPINLKSVMIGNGCTDWKTMFPAYYEMQCQPKTIDPVVDISSCVGTKQALLRCEKRLKEDCYDTTDAINCQAALSFCRDHIESPFWTAERNPYDLTKSCNADEMSDSLCYSLITKISLFLDRTDVRKTLGVDHSVQGNFSSCNGNILNRFGSALDGIFPADYYIEALLERGVKVLIYAGVNDWICNWVGNEQMTLNLEWTGKKAFASKPLRDWQVSGRAAGVTRSSGPLTFATIYNAGHMAPYDKGEESLELVKRWLANDEL